MKESRPSVTAAVVAATLLLLRDDPKLAHLVDPKSLDAIARALREAVPGSGWALDRLPWPVLRRLGFAVERAVSPGFVAHYALRKHVVREHVRTAIEAGFRQVVLVGAGFDMLSASLPERARVFEVDHPATQAVKQRAGSCPVNYVAVDLASERMGDALRRSSFDPRANTVFVAEGLLMYLEPSRVKALLADMADLPCRVRLVATVVTPDFDGRVRLHTQRRVVDYCMQLLGERFVWGESPERLEATLAAHGFVLESVTSTTNLPAEGLRRARRSTGEVVVAASTLADDDVYFRTTRTLKSAVPSVR